MTINRLSQGMLADYLACRRRFELRYQRRLSWPIPPLDEKTSEALRRGQQYHTMLQRYFLELPVGNQELSDPTLNRWWERFKQLDPDLPPGKRLPEFSITIPLGSYVLTGRFDLILLNDQKTQIFDWKTDARPPSEIDLRENLQTRLYLALAVEGSSALNTNIKAEQVSLTYWYVREPKATVTIPYSQKRHEENWAFLNELAADIEMQIVADEPQPLTEDLTQCVRCAYQLYCDREMATKDLSGWDEAESLLPLEPAIP